MRHYRCYFLSERGSIAAIEAVECLGDEEMSRVATSLLRARPHYYAVEAWDEERRVLYRARDAA